MISWKNLSYITASIYLASLCNGLAQASPTNGATGLKFVQIEAQNKYDRTAIANLGITIEAVKTGSVWALAHDKEIRKAQQNGLKILSSIEIDKVGENLLGFPPEDSRFHTYAQLTSAFQDLQSKNPELVRIQAIGKSTENRDILAIHINTNSTALETGQDTKPGIIFMGNHHAREHLSVEIPLMLAQYLVSHKTDSQIASLLNSRDIWIIPMVNPDGAEYDISTGKYKWWRKNRRNNGDGTYGVDLNRNYSYKWGTGGSDTETSSDVYMGKSPFSEAETTAVKNFVDSHLNAKILLSFHTFSELILYPWGYTYDPITQGQDKAIYEKMATTMASWNHYTPEQSSALYIASGDTTDWSYGVHGIYSFTFELSPKSMWDGGFYPGAKVIDRVFNDNLKPCLYLIGLADNPGRSVTEKPTGFLTNYVEPRVPDEFFLEPSPSHLF